MEFFKEIIQTFEQNGIDCRIDDSEHTITAFKKLDYTSDYLQGNKSYDIPVTILVLPVKATSIHQAELQNNEVRNTLKQRNSIIVSEDRWRRSNKMMRARLLAHLGIFRSVYARDCEVRKISRAEADCFLEKNHSYGGAKCKHCYGIFLNRVRPKDHPSCLTTAREKESDISSRQYSSLCKGELIAAAEFSNARRWNKNGKTIRSYEWIRYASLPDLHISGGMGKILGQFIKDAQPDDIMSYADLEWSDGDVYRKLGFVNDGIKSPVTFAIDTELWTRTPIARMPVETNNINKNKENSKYLFVQNLGSIKYRLKLTDY